MLQKFQKMISPHDPEQKIDRLFEIFYGSRRRVATAGVGLLAIWMAFHVIFGANGMIVYRNKKSDYRQLQQQLNSLQQENDTLTKQVEGLRHDPKAIEREAREQLRYAKPGEVIYLLPGSATDDKPPANAAAKK